MTSHGKRVCFYVPVRLLALSMGLEYEWVVLRPHAGCVGCTGNPAALRSTESTLAGGPMTWLTPARTEGWPGKDLLFMVGPNR